jgi:GT2 family glycosyltransferase
MTGRPSLAVLLVCHNRRDATLRAMRSLRKACAGSGGFALQPVLFDDASTDGTVEAVLAEFPETLILRGNGSAFWNGGLHEAWSRALALRPDAYLWLNDDVALDDDALDRLADAWHAMSAASPARRFILVGSTRGADGTITYGGHRLERSPFALRLRLQSPSSDLLPIDTFNGNIVLVPQSVVDEIGINDPAYFHGFGDNDYGLRASRAGIAVRLLAGTLGLCEANEAKRRQGFNSPQLPLRERWRRVNTHFGLPFASWWRFTRRHSGLWFPLHFLLPYRRLLLPGVGRSGAPGLSAPTRLDP